MEGRFMRYTELYDELLREFLSEKGIQLDDLEINEEANSYAIDISTIAERYNNMNIKYDFMFDRSGYYENNTIYVNRFDSWQRQRFTIAHELGHALFQHGDSNRHTDMSTYSENELVQERIANKFAADILMPKELLIKAISKSKLEILSEKKKSINLREQEVNEKKIISRAAQLMEVSEISLDYRIKNLKLEVL